LWSTTTPPFASCCGAGWSNGSLWFAAGSATDALALMVAHTSNIVLCDIRMPGRDGVWLMQKIMEAWPQTVFVMTSAGGS
jgi:DNA-binding NarL/FixJ family response regulator